MPRLRYAAATAGLLALLLLGGCGEAQPSAAQPSAAQPSAPQPSAASVGELTFTGTTLDGRAFDARTLAGRPVVLWFWAPWCPTCAAEAPDVLAVQEQRGDQVSVVGVAGLDEAKNMQPFVDRTKTGTLTHLSDPTGQIWRRFKVSQQSTYVLLDDQGEVAFSGALSGPDLQRRVAGLTA